MDVQHIYLYHSRWEHKPRSRLFFEKKAKVSILGQNGQTETGPQTPRSCPQLINPVSKTAHLVEPQKQTNHTRTTPNLCLACLLPEDDPSLLWN